MPKFDKKPKTDELMEAIRFKGRQGTAKAVRNTHTCTLSSHEFDACSAPYLEKESAQGRVCGCRHGRGRRSMRWTRTKAAAAAALLPSPKKRSATAALPVSTAFFLRSTDWESLPSSAGGQASVVPTQAALQVQVRAQTSLTFAASAASS